MATLSLKELNELNTEFFERWCIPMKKENDPSIEEQQEELKEAVLNDKDKKK